MQPLSRTELRTLRSLTHHSVRERRGAFLLEGTRALNEAMRFPEKIQMIAATQEAASRSSIADLLERAAGAGVKIRSLGEMHLDGVAETETPSGLVGMLIWRPARPHRAEQLITDLERIGAGRVLCLDSVGDPGNVGSLIRSAEAFKIDAVLLGAGSVEVTNPKVVRAAVGSLLGLPYVAVGQALKPALKVLESRGWSIYRAETHRGERPPVGVPEEPWLLLVGSEARGINPDLCTIGRAIKIPTPGSVESLNVAVAGGILLYAFSIEGGSNG